MTTTTKTNSDRLRFTIFLSLKKKTQIKQKKVVAQHVILGDLILPIEMMITLFHRISDKIARYFSSTNFYGEKKQA